jgi:hypothetical protein
MAVTPSNIIAGFHVAGIYQFDSNAIPGEDFGPSLVPEQKHGENQDRGQLDIRPVLPIRHY